MIRPVHIRSILSFIVILLATDWITCELRDPKAQFLDSQKVTGIEFLINIERSNDFIGYRDVKEVRGVD